MPETTVRIARRWPSLGVRGRLVFASLLAFVVFNAVFDVRVNLAAGVYAARAAKRSHAAIGTER